MGRATHQAYRRQVTAIASALPLIERLPAGTIWSLTVTDEADDDSAAVLNIFAPEIEWARLAVTIGLKGRSTLLYSVAQIWTRNDLTVSFTVE